MATNDSTSQKQHLSCDKASEGKGSSRRDFLRAAGLASGVALARSSAGAGHFAVAESALASSQTPSGLLPTIKLGPHVVTRLIIGGNPIYGYSHFNRLLSRHQIAWHTPQRVVELLKRCEEAGINTWQNSYAPRTLRDLDRYRAEGGTMQWLCLGKPDWERRPELVNEAAKRHPIGIAPHGSLADRLHRQNKLEVLTDLLKRIRDQGVLVGLSAHNPALVALSEEKGWPVDYYMCCLYYRTRSKEELKKLLGGDLPLGEIYLPSDPARMFGVIRATQKPCLAYKVLAAGRRIRNSAEIRQCFETAFSNIKPTDAVIVGMYQQFNDQVGENAALVREICT
ncbi:hypothetical protein MYX65_04210 [Acidobacteria bacterium AH-259-L09]|nr:hypothetical protein [Acidobacteria bacterium AH-259-L09]